MNSNKLSKMSSKEVVKRFKTFDHKISHFCKLLGFKTRNNHRPGVICILSPNNKFAFWIKPLESDKVLLGRTYHNYPHQYKNYGGCTWSPPEAQECYSFELELINNEILKLKNKLFK